MSKEKEEIVDLYSEEDNEFLEKLDFLTKKTEEIKKFLDSLIEKYQVEKEGDLL